MKKALALRVGIENSLGMVAASGFDLPGEIERVLSEWEELRDPRVEPIAGGLIHQSFYVRDGDREYVLQRVSPIFSPGIQENIVAVTEHLRARGIRTPELLTTRAGRSCAELGEGGRWRLETWVPGVSFDSCEDEEQARSAAVLVARFHSALHDLDHDFLPIGIPLHDTASHLRNLEEALAGHSEHRLQLPVSELAAEIFAAVESWEPLAGLPRRVVHGDLKFNNVLFAGRSGAARHQAVSLIDLDTVSRMPLYTELGDAWRSWCNRRGEDVEEAEFDEALFRSAALGYLGALTLDLEPDERRSLAVGIERISLELAARFAADALQESYFGWDAERFPAAAEHNLTRARGQLSLYRQARETRAERVRLFD